MKIIDKYLTEKTIDVKTAARMTVRKALEKLDPKAKVYDIPNGVTFESKGLNFEVKITKVSPF